MAISPITGPNDPRLPKHFTPNGHFDPNFRGGPGLEGRGFRPMVDQHNGGGNGPNITQGLLSAFLPGQQSALAQQLNQGFGGGMKQWNGILGQTYSDSSYTPNPLGYPRDIQNNRGHVVKNDGKGDGGGGGNHDVGGFDNGHVNPQSAAIMADAAQNVRPNMQAGQPQIMPNIAQGQMPTVQGQIPQQMQPQMMLGQQPQMNMPSGLSPQVMALLRARFGGR
jgi:hypothetical protein